MKTWTLVAKHYVKVLQSIMCGHIRWLSRYHFIGSGSVGKNQRIGNLWASFDRSQIRNIQLSLKENVWNRLSLLLKMLAFKSNQYIWVVLIDDVTMQPATFLEKRETCRENTVETKVGTITVHNDDLVKWPVIKARYMSSYLTRIINSKRSLVSYSIP